MQGLIAAKKRVDKVMEWLCIAILGVMAAVLVCQAAAQQFFGGSGAHAEAVFQSLFVWMVMHGSVYVLSLKERLDVSVLKVRLKNAALLAAEALTGVCLLLFVCVVVIYGGYVLAVQAASDSAGLGIPAAVVCSAIPISGGFTLFYAVYYTALAVDGMKKSRSNGQSAERAG